MNDGEDRVLVSQLRNSVVRVSLVLSLKLLEQRVVVGSGETGEGRREMARKREMAREEGDARKREMAREEGDGKGGGRWQGRREMQGRGRWQGRREMARKREMAREGGKEKNRQRRHITHIRRKRKEEMNTIWTAMSISLNKQKLCLVL